MMSNLDVLIQHYEQEVATLKGELQLCLDSLAYTEAAWVYKALSHTSTTLERLYLVRDPHYEDKRFLKRGITIEQKSYEKWKSRGYESERYIRQIQEHERELTLLEEATSKYQRRFVVESQHLEETLDLVFRNDLSPNAFRLVLDNEKGYFFLFKKTSNNTLSVLFSKELSERLVSKDTTIHRQMSFFSKDKHGVWQSSYDIQGEHDYNKVKIALADTLFGVLRWLEVTPHTAFIAWNLTEK